MSEHVDGSNVFSSGGHRWSWGERAVLRKTLTAVGVEGAASIRLARGARPGLVAGLLKATGADRAAADSALDALEKALETLAAGEGPYTWEDDQAHSGEGLLVLAYRRSGGRQYGLTGTTWTAHQLYAAEVLELDGAPFI